MLISIIILILLAAVVTGLVLYPKSGERENGMTAVVNAVMLSCCCVVLGVWVSDRLIGRVHLAAVMTACGGALFLESGGCCRHGGSPFVCLRRCRACIYIGP